MAYIQEFDDYDLPRFLAHARSLEPNDFNFVVTPNADHLVRLRDDNLFRGFYGEASFVLLDSRLVAHALRLFRGQRFPVCTGSDLTAALFSQVISAEDAIVVVGGTREQAEQLRLRHGLGRLVHHAPPMGLAQNPEAIEACVRFIEEHSPFRFCFLALGSPQQEMIASRVKARGRARGLALCIGASINFLTGSERRAPQWMQRLGLEWLFRLGQAPRRMWRRYVLNAPLALRMLFTGVFRLRATRP
ncbi:MAG: WecB/TagA/CpsF family glycosyltransferase [Cystobacter sp.]